MLDEHYRNQKLADIYELQNTWSKDNDFYLSLAPSLSDNSPISILDLGCGTGMTCNAFAKNGHKVVGVDPARSMLNVARRAQNSHKIKWVLGDAQSFTTSEKFDLVIMSGHAFQVLLTENDVLSTFNNVASFLKPDARFVFETRNPAIDWAKKFSNQSKFAVQKKITEKAKTVLADTQVKERTDNTIKFETIYTFEDETIVSKSVLRFWSLGEIATLLEKTALTLYDVYGDWEKNLFDADSSLEIICSIGMKTATKPRQ